MGLSSFTSGGSTIKGDKIVDALYNGIILLSYLETKSNKDNNGQQTNYVAWTIGGDATKTFTATLTLPARMVRNATTGKVLLVPKNFVVDYVTWEPGTGDLASAASLPQAIVDLCDTATYLERQIDPNIVVQTPNQVQITPNQEAGTFDVQIVLPMNVSSDETTGAPDFKLFDYLGILDTQVV